MKKLIKELENRKIDDESLIKYGFILNNNIYRYEKIILNNEFKVVVEIQDNMMYSKLIEISYNDEYLMADVLDTVGEYVSKVKEEYNLVIDDIIDKCTSKDIFKSRQAQDVIRYIKEKYNDDLEYLWTKFPKNAVWRNKDNNKWYGALLVLSERQLGIDSDKIIDILDLRYKKEKIKEIIDNEKIFPGYHMNKDSWITIKLDKSVDIKEIYKMIDNSYNISLDK